MATISAERRQEQVPDDVYIQFVRSLFDNARILLIGGACYALIATMVYFETGNALYIGFACLLLAVNVWRYSGIRGFTQPAGSSNRASTPNAGSTPILFAALPKAYRLACFPLSRSIFSRTPIPRSHPSLWQ